MYVYAHKLIAHMPVSIHVYLLYAHCTRMPLAAHAICMYVDRETEREGHFENEIVKAYGALVFSA